MSSVVNQAIHSPSPKLQSAFEVRYKASLSKRGYAQRIGGVEKQRLPEIW